MCGGAAALQSVYVIVWYYKNHVDGDILALIYSRHENQFCIFHETIYPIIHETIDASNGI